jgi:hypothetical protein
MPRDDDYLLDLDELAALLREHEGPPRAVPRRRSPRRRRLRSRTVGFMAAALLVGSSLGFGVASSLTPSGGAAEPTAGLGFLPERGWYVLRSRFEATPAWPSFAVASNIPLDPLDARVAARRDWSGVPFHALQTLEPGGIVILASFSLRGVHAPSDESFPRRALPLRLRDAWSTAWGSGHVRQLGRYEVRAAVNRHNVIVTVYFGSLRPSRVSTIAAQRQLDRLVVGSTSEPPDVDKRAFPLHPSSDVAVTSTTASRTFDRKFACRPVAFGGIGDLDVSSSPPGDLNFNRPTVAHLFVRTGGSEPVNNLVFVRARPQVRYPGLTNPEAVGGPGGIFAHRSRCVATRAAVPLSSRGLPGPPTRFERNVDCPVRGRVLVRVQATMRAPTNWRPRAYSVYAGARQNVERAAVAVRSQRTGAPIAYAELGRGRATRLWYSGDCS